MGLVLYRLLLRLGLPVVALRHWWRHRGEAGQRADWREFFGYYFGRSIRRIIWLHAVSANAVPAAVTLARAVRTQYPDHHIMVTSGTIAGREALRRAFADQALLAYLPYDLPGPARRFLEHFRPRLGIVIGVEVWPVLFAACRRSEIPLMIANARLSSGLARSYARFGALSRPAFASLAACCVQDRATSRRLRRLGAQTVTVTGNVIFDTESDPDKVEEGRALMAALRGRKALLFAGSCEGEEQMLLDALGEDDGTLIIIVPRHPERFGDVAELAAARGMDVARRSKGEAPHVGRRVFLGDTVNEMPFYYAVSTVAIIGGSFTSAGGQNPIEACAAGVPAVIGPHMTEFADATRAALLANAAIRVIDIAEAARVARNLLDFRELRERMALAGLKLSAAHRGATGRHLAVCRHLHPPTPEHSSV
jgi:3-deoxy-D-manno-octulosonic-acid transferase